MIAFTGVLYLVWVGAKALARVHDLTIWAKRVENVYIVGSHPDDEEAFPKLNLPEDVALFVEHRRVMATVKEVEQLLRDSRNRMFEGGHLTIYPFIMGEGEFVNETWEEYTQRVAAFILEDRRARHKKMRDTNKNGYLRHVKGQEGL